MKAIFSTALLALVLGASSLFSQTTAPEEGAIAIGSFQMDLDILSEPQPDMQYSVSNDAGTVVTTVWMTSGGDVLVTTTVDEVGEWKESDPLYHNATMDYTYDKLGANAVWMASEMGYDVGPETKVTMVKSVENTVDAERKYMIHENGTNTEVQLVLDNGTY